MTKEQIAEVCHGVNKAYCEALGDTSQPEWKDAPQWQKDSALLGVELHLAHPDAGPEQSHESWLAQKKAEGWGYGPVKDPAKKEHPCCVPFNELPTHQQAKDFIFRAVVKQLGALVSVLLLFVVAGCAQAKSYQMGDLQVEVLDRPAAISQSLVVVGWCERVFLNNDGHCRSDKMNDMQVFVQTGFVTSLMGPVIQAGGMIGAGALIGDGLSKSGSNVSQNSQSSQANLNAVNQTNGRGPWRHGYR